MLKKNALLFSLAQRAIDVLIILGSWWLAFFIRFVYLPHGEQGLEELFLKLSLMLIIASQYFNQRAGLYHSRRFDSRLGEIWAVLKANGLTFLTLIVALYFIAPERVSRLHLLIFLALSSISLITLRLVIRNILRLFRRRGFNLRHVIFMGSGEQLKDYYHALKKFKDCGVAVDGWINSEGLASELGIPELPNHFNWQNSDLDAMIVGFKLDEGKQLKEFLHANHNQVIPIKVIPHLSYSFLGNKVEEFAGIPLIGLNEPDLGLYQVFLKRTFDFSASLLGLLLISPLLLLIGIGVKLSSPGPIFFSQVRMGVNGKVFKMFKFRSMRVATDNLEQKEWSNKENPRKTKFGNFLRKTSLDELPQLINVLKGDMSLVGPRPEQPYFVEKFRHEIPAYMLRHKTKAGITGWAQVNGWRGDTSLHKRIECDIFYIKNISFWFDLKIILLTFIKGFVNKNAY